MGQTYQQRRAVERIARGLCSRCGKNPLASETQCQPCLDGHKSLIIQVRKSRQAAGLCGKCGKVPPEPGKVCCARCAEDGNSRTQKMVSQRIAAKQCIRCGNPELETSRMCQRCAEVARLTANARSHGLTVAEYQEMIADGCQICGSTDRVQIDHDHSCCDFVANGYHRSRSCARCTRGVLCNQHNSIAANLESKEAVRVLEYLLASRVASHAPLVAYIRELLGKEVAADG